MDDSLTRQQFENIILPSSINTDSPAEGRMKLLKHDMAQRTRIDTILARVTALEAAVASASAIVDSVKAELTPIWLGNRQRMVLEQAITHALQAERQAKIADYEEVLTDHRRLVRKLDVVMNGANAAKQASLCDIVASFPKWLQAREQAVWEEALERHLPKFIDNKQFEQAPCYLCGHNGPNYYQPESHKCAAKYHAQHALAQGEQVKQLEEALRTTGNAGEPVEVTRQRQLLPPGAVRGVNVEPTPQAQSHPAREHGGGTDTPSSVG